MPTASPQTNLNLILLLYKIANLRTYRLTTTLFTMLASAMTMVEIGKSYWEDFIYKYKGLQHIEKGFDMVFPPEE